MIRRMQRADIDRVADIWLDTNIRAHNFISKQYWQKIKERKYLYHKKYTLFYIIRPAASLIARGELPLQSAFPRKPAGVHRGRQRHHAFHEHDP